MFGTSGIRGTVGTDVTGTLALAVGRAVASEGYDPVVIGRDCRESGRVLLDAVAAGLRECGAAVLDLGAVATPTVARSVDWFDADAGVAVTASHNPPPDNGLKLWTPTGRAFDRDQRAAVARRVSEEAFDLAAWDALGAREQRTDADERHVEALCESTPPHDAGAVVVDVGNGVGGVTADALSALGWSVTTLNAQPDGRFPGRPSEPTAEACATLRETVAATGAEFGVAHDGDADRAMAVTEGGTFVPGDVLLALFAGAVAEPGDTVAAPLNTSLAVDDYLDSMGVTVCRTRVGDGFVAAAAAQDGVAFGGEPSGAWIWPAETLAPDGPLAACRLAALVSEHDSLAALLDRVDAYPIRRESHRVDCTEAVVEDASRRAAQRYDQVETLDGVRVSVDDGWFLLRASGTQPLVRLTAEARTDERADALLSRARSLLRAARDETDAGGDVGASGASGSSVESPSTTGSESESE
jgi:phosphoglucosamine mutase